MADVCNTPSRHDSRWSLPDTGLVRRHHVLDLDEGSRAAVLLQNFERLLDQVAQVLAFLLRVVDAVALVHCHRRIR